MAECSTALVRALAACLAAAVAVSAQAHAQTVRTAPTASPKQVFFRYNSVDPNYGKLAFVYEDQPERVRFVDTLSCEVAYVAGGRGICLRAEHKILRLFSAVLFDAGSFRILGALRVQGLPSRVRVAEDGTVAALTVFVTGHSYASTTFSTRTLLVDVPSAQILADLEDFAVTRNDTPFKHRDFNFWGVTFTPDARSFYSTLSTQGQHLLVKGDVASRSAVVVHDAVECPSLSPDGRRVAFKRRLSGRGQPAWELRTLDLATGRETSLREHRSVDDQLEWLDHETVLYTLPDDDTRATPSTNVWRVAADGSRPPELFLRKASSPAVVRSGAR